MSQQLIGTIGNEFWRQPNNIVYAFYSENVFLEENKKTNDYINRYGKKITVNKIYSVKQNPKLDKLLKILKKKYHDIQYRGIVIHASTMPKIMNQNKRFNENRINKYLKC